VARRSPSSASSACATVGFAEGGAGTANGLPLASACAGPTSSRIDRAMRPPTDQASVKPAASTASRSAHQRHRLQQFCVAAPAAWRSPPRRR
jgi:hypothetical protein